MTESERAIVRACLEQTLLALGEAREVLDWWRTLSDTMRIRYRECQEMCQALRSNLNDKA